MKKHKRYTRQREASDHRRIVLGMIRAFQPMKCNGEVKK